ncbi:MAG: hypothetical protein IT337_18160 [Thermomicrobiales bacterium]|nr:hypothetical protein [Thermomicrobiales bacterium]
MISQDLELDVAFSGSPQQQDLAAQILTLMRARARFMAATAPIRIP